MLFKKSFFNIVLCSWALAGYCASAGELKLATSPFSEEILPAARISGNIVVGIQTTIPLAAPTKDLNIAAYIPDHWSEETICLKVTSGDGVYVSLNAYVAPPDWTGGTALFEYPTKHRDLLMKLHPDKIAARATLGDCNAPSKENAAVHFNSASGGDELTLLINSFDADLVFAYVGSNTKPIRCTPVSASGTSSFDTRCSIKVKPELNQVRLLRSFDGQIAPETVFSIWNQN